MKTFTVSILAILFAVSANAATIKQAWNLPADAVLSDGTVNGRVTAAGDCLLDNDNLFSCTNDPAERVVDEYPDNGEGSN